MRWGNLLPLTASLPWLLLLVIGVSSVGDNQRCSSNCMPVGFEIWALATPLIIISALIAASMYFGRRRRWSG